MSHEYSNFPLPSNWEQQYDSQTKRYFFIDHANQLTTWVDPRIELYKHYVEMNKNARTVNIDQPLRPSTSDASSRQHQNPNNSNAETHHMNNSSINSVSQHEHNKQVKKEALKKTETDLKNKNSAINQPTRQKVNESSNSSTSKEALTRLKRIEDIHKKYPQFSITKISEIFDDNFGNISSTESILQREIHLKVIEEENQKEIKEEAGKKAELERLNRAKEDSNKENLISSSNKESIKTGTEQKSSIDTHKPWESPNKNQVATGMSSGSYNTTFATPSETKTSISQGPNKSLFKGPNPSNRVGPSISVLSSQQAKLSKGPNPANRCGPRSSQRSED